MEVKEFFTELQGVSKSCPPTSSRNYVELGKYHDSILKYNLFKESLESIVQYNQLITSQCAINPISPRLF